MKRLKWLLASAAVVGVLAGSVDFRHGDLRYDIADKTMRHWSLADASIKFNAACAWIIAGGFPCTTGTTYTLSGPSSANFGQSSSNFTVTSGAAALITPADAEHGVFTPSSVQLSPSGATFTYEPLKTGTNTVSTTNNNSLSNPSGIAVTIANALSTGYPGFTSGWNTGNSAPTLTTSTVDPWNGSAGATLTESSTVSAGYQNIYTNTISAVPTVTVALFVKQAVIGANGTSGVELNINNPTFSAGGDVIFNPSTCAEINNATWGGATISSYSATKPAGIGAGWCLVQMNIALGASYTTSIEQIFITSGGTDEILGDGTSALNIYGPVME